MALESLDKGLAVLDREDPFDAAWMRGMIQSNRADMFQITGDNSGRDRRAAPGDRLLATGDSPLGHHGFDRGESDSQLCPTRLGLP